jgi:hypothetical protein
VIGGVELDADREGWRNYFAGLGEDFEDETGAFFGGAAVGVGAEVCLGWLGLGLGS